MNRKIVLASTSSRRKELLARLGLTFSVEESGYEEDMTLKMTPKKLAEFLALGKAKMAAGRHKDGLIIGGDSFVILGKEVLGKPKTAEKAKEMLRKISGKKVDIYSGWAIVDAKTGEKESGVSKLVSWIKKLDEQEIDRYVATGEPLDKAGAFAIQEKGAAIIEKSEGDYLGAVGLSLYEITKGLKKFEVEVF